MSFANNIMSADLGSDSGGLSGPFLDYKSSGSAKYGIKPMGWSLTEKDQNNEKKVTDRTEALTQGIVLDIDTLKFGWEKETQNGAPERSWAPDFKLANFPRPDNSTRAHGKTGKMVPAWSEVFAIRVGLPTGTVATWSQATFGTWQAMKQIVELVQAEYNANTPKLPVVAVTGHEADYGSNIPIFALTRWVDRPGFMTATAAPVAMETQPAPAPAPTPAPAAQMDPAVAAAASAF
jgi:hypothetical protein